MLKNSLIIDTLKDCNTFNTMTYYQSSTFNTLEFNIFFIFAKNPNKVEIVDYFNKDKNQFNLNTLNGIKNLKKYISLNALHCLFIYVNKTTKKILGNLVNNNKENKNQDFFIDLFNHSFHLKDIFKNFSLEIIDLNLAKKISSIIELEDIIHIFQEIDHLIQIKYEDINLKFSDDVLLSLYNKKDFIKYFGENFDDFIPVSMKDLNNKVIESIKFKLNKEKEILGKTIFLDLEAIDYSSECTSIGLIYNENKYKKIIKPLKNLKPTKFMVELTGITREMLLKGTLFKDMLGELYSLIPEFNEYTYLVFGVFDKVIWKSSYDSNMTKHSRLIYNHIMKNFYDFSALTNTCMVDYTLTNNNLSLINSLKFLEVKPIEGIHNPIVDAENLKLLYINFFKEENYHKYIKNNISFYMKKSIASSNFKTLLFCLYSEHNDKTIFEYYLRHKVKENIKNLEKRI